MALVSVHYRSDQLKKNVEIQLAVPDCNQSFTRPLPGGGMYPLAVSNPIYFEREQNHGTR